VSVLATKMAPSTQTVQPWMFGHGETKATCLWLKNLPPLRPTNIVEGREARVHKMPPGPNRWREIPHVRRRRGGDGRPVGLGEAGHRPGRRHDAGAVQPPIE